MNNFLIKNLCALLVVVLFLGQAVVSMFQRNVPLAVYFALAAAINFAVLFV